MTSEICSDSERDSLIASPSSFMSALSLGFTHAASGPLYGHMMQPQKQWVSCGSSRNRTPACDVCTVARIAPQIYDECVAETSGADKFRAASRVIGRRAGASR